MPLRTSMACTTWSAFPAIRRPAVPTAAIARTPELTSLVDHALDGGRRALQGRSAISPRGLEALAEAGHLGAIDQRPPRPVRVSLADVELHGVRTHVDDGVASRLGVDERRQAAWVAHVRVAAEADGTDGGDDR